MPIDLNSSLILWGVDFGFAHGVYPKTLRRSSLNKVYKSPKDTPFKDKTYVLLCFRRGTGYPAINSVTSAALLPLGGVANYCSDKLGTFGVYRVIDPQTASLKYWVDFDHWPVTWDEVKKKVQKVPGLDRGHRHATPNTGIQLPAPVEDTVLYATLILTNRV